MSKLRAGENEIEIERLAVAGWRERMNEKAIRGKGNRGAER